VNGGTSALTCPGVIPSPFRTLTVFFFGRGDGAAAVWLFRMDPKRKLKGLLARIFSDAVAEPAEREELQAFLATGILSQDAIFEVFRDFVATTWKITVADGTVSDIEKTRLREIAAVLPLEKNAYPPEWAALLD
jgi:hypothetical protein